MTHPLGSTGIWGGIFQQQDGYLETTSDKFLIFKELLEILFPQKESRLTPFFPFGFFPPKPEALDFLQISSLLLLLSLPWLLRNPEPMHSPRCPGPTGDVLRHSPSVEWILLPNFPFPGISHLLLKL